MLIERRDHMANYGAIRPSHRAGHEKDRGDKHGQE
jgi:hypothetical protein